MPEMFGSSTACDISLNSRLTAEQRAIFQDTRTIREILGSAKTIAIVGLSNEPTKASNMVASYLQDEGYTIVPIHPKANTILGERAYAKLSDVPFHIDVVDIFRPASEAPAIVDEAIKAGAKAVWMQLRLANLEAAQKAKDAGLKVVADKCIKMEHGRFGGMLHWAGMNTEVISARRRMVTGKP